jgi:DNA invertase Pin-like site-specific DNA recombinase
MRAAIYARVSTTAGQTCENQLLELRRYVEVRGWTLTEYVDEGVSGAKDRRPALDRMLLDARRRRLDVVVCWSLDRMGRSLKHLVILLDDLQALGVGFISVREGLDWTTPSGRLQAQLLAMIAEFERARIQERVVAGLARAKAQGRKLGRPRVEVSLERLEAVRHLPVRQAARELRVSRATLQRRLAEAMR